MGSVQEKYDLRFRKKAHLLKIAPYHTLKFGGTEKMSYLCNRKQGKNNYFTNPLKTNMLWQRKEH